MTDRENEKRKQVVALHYDGKRAPLVTAKGQGYVADEILALAQAHGIPLYESPELARLLGRLELGDEIPVSLYTAVAEVIAFAYRLRGKPERGQE